MTTQVEYVIVQPLIGSPTTNSPIRLIYGSGAPSNTIGNDGDSYRNVDNDDWYGPKTNGTWPAAYSIRGYKGDKGDKGDIGTLSQVDQDYVDNAKAAAAASASSASGSASAADSSAQAAAASQGAAAASATAADGSAQAAAGSAAAADSSAQAASSSKDAAAASASQLASSLASFQKLFLGEHDADPTVDNQGNPLVEGTSYFATQLSPPRTRIYLNGAWADQSQDAETATANAQLAATQAAQSAADAAASASASSSAGASADAASASAANAAASEKNAADSASAAAQSAATAQTAVNGYAALTGAAFTGNVSLKASQPSLTLWDTSESDGYGVFQWRSIGASMQLFRNTASAGDFSTMTVPVSFIETDVAQFAQRPTFAGNTPWDSGNFNPANYAQLAGAPFTGPVSVSTGGAAASISLNANAANYREVVYQTAGNLRWAQGVTNEGEAGANAGSNWFLSRYADDGSGIDTALTINRATGVLNTSKRPTFAGNAAWDAGNFNPENYAPLNAVATFAEDVTLAGGNLNMTGSLASIEMGSTTAVGSPFIDFHSSGGNRDYDARIIASNGSTTTDGIGVLTFIAKSGCTFSETPVILKSTSVYSPPILFTANGYSKWIRLNSGNNALEFLNSAQTSVIASLTDGGSLSCSGNLTCQNGSLWSYGYGGNNAAGVFYLGSSGNTYIYNTGSQVNLFSNTGNFQITAQGVPLYLTNLQASSYWEAGPNTSNSFIILNSNGTGVYVPWGGTSWVANSDESIKNIQAPITNALDAIDSIRTVRYTLKIDESEAPKVYIGTIAQDVQEEFPELVHERDGVLGVEYDGLSVIALAAIKELSGRVKQLEALLAAHGMTQ